MKTSVKKDSGLFGNEIMEVRDKIASIRGMQVIADADKARLYGVQTKEVNQAVRNNPDKFPADYLFTLSKSELQDLQSKILTTNVSSKRRNPTKVFTEKGLYMLATILKSERATSVTFAIIETFAKVRSLKQELVELHTEPDKDRQTERVRHFSDTLTDLVMPDLQTSETESSLEINFLIGKVKHSVKRVRKELPKE